MNNSPIKTIRLSGKTIQPQDLPPEAWTVVFGKNTANTELQDYFAHVSWVYRGIDIRANSVKRVPFVIENIQGNTIDESGQYKNAVGFFPKPKHILGLVEMALAVFGYAYLYKQPNVLNKPMGVRYLLPSDIDVRWQKDAEGRVTGLGGFHRRKLNKTLTPEEIIYFWKDDPFVEFGHPESSPLMAAAADAGVILNVNRFAASYFERGAIKATLLAVAGNPPPGEKERIKSLWGRLMKGIKSVFGEMVVNADSLTPVVIGEGLEALSDKNLTSEKREAIATALGVPHSILFSGASNFAVSQQDEKSLYDQTAIPECEFIEEVLNEQLFEQAGYRLRFTPDAMDIYQEDETRRAGAMVQFMDALDKAGSFEMAHALFKIYGVEVDDEALGWIQQHFSGVAQAANQNGAEQPVEKAPEVPEVPIRDDMDVENKPQNRRTDLDRWKTWAVNRIKTGKTLDGFESNEIAPALYGAILGALSEAKTLEDVIQVFDNAWLGYP